jgi:multidrug efflux pump subunit AcrA (membrane-fusion protein)
MIVPTADRTKGTVLVKVRFDDRNSRILPEMSARVAFLERRVAANETLPRTAVNPAALVKQGNRSVLYLIKDGRAMETTVTTGAHIGDQVEILSGAKAGDKVALKPLDRLKNGSRIKTAEK